MTDFADAEAERIAAYWLGRPFDCGKLKDQIAQALRAAYQKGIGSNTKIVQYVDDAVKAYEDGFNTGQFSCCHDCADAQDDARKEGFEACREAAAKVAKLPHACMPHCPCKSIAEKIRNLRPEGGEVGK